ncbi:MAG: glutathione S-transferase N-terminal domain-containing protein [Candidatus Dadabacteria bacterium]|nr:glutathione S-transferase N-terminal domain-containing protein [Candidatus Dadabacteria bacterium]MCY4261904.1 glutathione S-transferase N-terminal domain-containing protein [Candidatus Dadabacteria bacterium]
MIDLYTAATPNGKKISIMLEELGADYEVHALDLSRFEHKEPWFIKINPNGKIPAIVDNDDGTAVFESGAILIYLADKFESLLPPIGDKSRTTCIQWLMFQMSAVGPMQGQLNVFLKYAPEKIPYAIRRYAEETRRLYSVLDERLSKLEYIAGEYSIVDISTWPWINAYDWVRMDLEAFPNLSKWRAKVGERPAVIKGNGIPPSPQEEETEEEKIKRIQKLLS